MAARILDGREIARQIQHQVALDAAELARQGTPPRLVAVQVGENPASRIYTKMQGQSCAAVGIEYELVALAETSSQEDLIARIQSLNLDPRVTGIILQMPLPGEMDAREAMNAIAPQKDVEAANAVNIGRLFFRRGYVAPCTPLAALEVLKRACPDLAGKETVIVSHSEIIGKPIAMMLLESKLASPTVTVCHVATRDLAVHTRRAEVLIVGTGIRQARWLSYKRRRKNGEKCDPPDLSPLVTADMLSEGVVVIDVAINRIPRELDADGEPVKNEKGAPAMVTRGDVDFEGAEKKASAITPVPGGVGPVTVAMLLRNTIACARAQREGQKLS
ncbi:MAG: bifunctional 5,10-methylenetetrahydrofolate dehydrogenase/5,10-methenyltetrahydrofolate cyclohydrolase [Phycisphaerae bacterium]